MALDKNLDPGFPALHVTNAPNASAGSGGTTMESASAYAADAKHNTVFTPNQTFPWAVGPNGTQTFYKGVPVSIGAGLKTQLVAAGKGS